MALEAFLVNPPRGMKRVRRRRRNIEAGFYDGTGQFHPIRSSWDYDTGRVGEGKRASRAKKPKRKKDTLKRGIMGRPTPWLKRKPLKRKSTSRRRSRGRGNPLGEEVIILNPRGKRVRRRRRVRAINPRRRRRVSLSNPKRRVYRRRRIRAHNPRHVYRRRRSNPIRRHRRRRNPAIEAALGYGFGDLAKLAMVGAMASIATTAIPRALGLTDETKKYLGQAATAIGGGLIVSQLVKREFGGIWAVAGLAVIVADVMRQYVLARIGLPGLAAYPAELSGYPSEYYLSEGQGYPMVPTLDMYDTEQVF